MYNDGVATFPPTRHTHIHNDITYALQENKKLTEGRQEQELKEIKRALTE